MKYFISSVVIIAMLFTAGCGKNKQDSSATSNSTIDKAVDQNCKNGKCRVVQ